MEEQEPKQLRAEALLQTLNPLWPFIPADAKLLVELGDGDSGTKEYYQRINPQGQYISIDAENPNPDISPSSVDCLLCHDYLSHLRQPGVFLEQAATWLQPEGQVLARVANPQHWHRIVQLLRGNSIETVEPTRNRVSIELFTLNNIKELFAAAGLRVYEIQTIDSKGEEFPEFLRLMAPIIPALGIDSTTFATQTGAAEYLIRATKSPTPPRRLFIQTILMAPTGCDRVRVIEPDSFSATIPGVRTFSQVKTADLKAGLPNEEKVFIWQRTILSYPDSIPQLKQLLQRDYLIVAEIDDDPLRRPEYEQNQFLSYRGCHCVQTSTEPLAAYLRQHNPNVAVFPNQLAYLSPWGDGEQGSRGAGEQGSRGDGVITIFFGALNRENDWQPIMASLNKILSQHQERIRCQVIHDRRFFDGLETSQKEFTPFCPYERYLEILAGCDIALLPLGETRINSMKSDLKFLECAGHGAAVLASPTVYEKSIIDGETGLIYHNSTEFETLLNQLITDGEMRQRLATNAYNWVAQNRLLCQHYRQRRDWYLQMRDQLPRLNQELRDRVPELFD
ncbi:glycosyltransferase [[Phormidium] sp. ETS-05]|uniref:glycosyltransferase family protein n=1 Tax=[Phormidium] sp. ETS-05 TaxID=222819 RepID=UPI0018EEE3C9|nr:glycosyltransferase [[Phormidium] sp. ETS-05]